MGKRVINLSVLLEAGLQAATEASTRRNKTMVVYLGRVGDGTVKSSRLPDDSLAVFMREEGEPALPNSSVYIRVAPAPANSHVLSMEGNPR